jgi:replicative DNA helicase
MSKAIEFDYDLFEKVIVYNCFMDSSYFETIYEHLNSSFFSNEKNKTVINILCDFYRNNKKIPNSTELKLNVLDENKRKDLKDVLTGFKDIEKKYNKELLLQNTEKFLKEKAVFNTVLKTSLNIQSGDINTSDILKSFEKACSISLIDNNGFDYLEKIDEHCVELQKVFKYIPSGWKWLDERIGGGFLATGKALYVFYGVTNVGKSIFLGNIATNILNQNKTVLLISMEMSEQVYAKRISAQLSQIPMNNLATEVVLLKDKLNSYKVKHKNSKLIIKEFPPKTVSALHLKTYIEKLINSGIKPDVIVLDYLNLMAPNEKGLSSYEAVKQTTEQVRAMSYQFECPIITATQTNRSGYNEVNPGLETTSESMGLSHTADAQFSIWTEKEDIELGIIHLGITKNRFGPRDCHTVLEIDYPTLTLKDPDSVSSSFIAPKTEKKTLINKQDVQDTIGLLESLGEDID